MKTEFSTQDITDDPAFAPVAKNGYALETWRISVNLIHWDTLFAFGFTSYQSFLAYIKKHQSEPMDEVREILMRLYMLEPSFPTMFVSPSITEFLDFVFNLGPDATEEDRKRCIALLAPVLGRNRGSGYRWLRNREGSDNPVTLPIRRLAAKVFSMDPKTSRRYFWLAALATAQARGLNTATMVTRLKSAGVRIG